LEEKFFGGLWQGANEAANRTARNLFSLRPAFWFERLTENVSRETIVKPNRKRYFTYLTKVPE
jgi:hypothetical protein